MDTWTSVGQMFGINTKEPPSLMSIYRYFYNSGENKYEFGFKVRCARTLRWCQLG
jgi:hypothetical protein